MDRIEHAATRHIATRRLAHTGGTRANLGAIHERSVVRRHALNTHPKADLDGLAHIQRERRQQT